MDDQHILLVEDDESLQQLIEKLLKNNNYIVSKANNIDEAQKLVKLFIFDLIILDVMLPDSTGLEFYKNSKFIKILKLNAPLGSGNVLNTNKCEISICETRIKNKFVIFCAIDNLVKGASGQAIQNMNLLFKFSETLGLE